MTIERCSCNALIVAWRRKTVEVWRESHHHDMGDEGGGQPPYVHESASTSERSYPDWQPDTYARPVMGFRPE